MDLGMSTRVKALRDQIAAMVRDEIAPLDTEYHAEVSVGDRWEMTPRQTEILEGLKTRARDAGLWNLWLTDSDKGHGLTTPILPRKWAAFTSPQRCLIATPPTPATWRCLSGTVPKR